MEHLTLEKLYAAMNSELKGTFLKNDRVKIVFKVDDGAGPRTLSVRSAGLSTPKDQQMLTKDDQDKAEGTITFTLA